MKLLKLLSILLSTVFFTLADLHFFWAAGGKWGKHNALPQKLNGKTVLNPGPRDCLVVGIGLVGFGLFYLSKVSIIAFQLPRSIQRIGGKIIPGIFFLRAIGDFKYCGLFKRIKGTGFARLDHKLYTPLCLVISLLGLLIDRLSKVYQHKGP